MGKCGKGLAKEFAIAVLQGGAPEVFNTEDLRKFIKRMGWSPSESYVNVLLPNSASSTHSKTYPQYFNSVGDGHYKLADDVGSLL